MTDTIFPYGDDVRDPYDADDTKNPHEPSGEEEPEDDGDDGDDEAADEQPVKRRPGRPRKNPAS